MYVRLRNTNAVLRAKGARTTTTIELYKDDGRLVAKESACEVECHFDNMETLTLVFRSADYEHHVTHCIQMMTGRDLLDINDLKYAAESVKLMMNKWPAKAMLKYGPAANDFIESALAILRHAKNYKEEKVKRSTEKLELLIEAADKRRDQVVLCLMGQPGIGKTEAVERFARKHDRKVVHIIASQILPTEVSGITMPNQETHTMDVFDHSRLGHMEDGDILFFDELLKGQQQVLNACLTLIQERRMMSGRKLPDVLVIAAANPLPSPKSLPLEIRQRFMFVDVEWDKESWIKYMARLGFRDTEAVQKVADILMGNVCRPDVSSWNLLTPRSATKAMLWLRSVEDEPELWKAVVDLLGEMYGAMDAIALQQATSHKTASSDLVATELMKTLEKAKSKEAHLLSAQIGTIFKEEGGVGKKDLASLMERLQALPEWDEIKEYLASVEM